MRSNLRARMLTMAAILLSLVLIGCGSSPASSKDSSDTTADGAFVGTWELADMDDLSSEELEGMKDLGYNMFFVLGDGGEATYEFMGEVEEGHYELTGDDTARLDLDDEDNWAETMKIENGKLVLESVDGGFCRFERITEDERAAYNARHGLGEGDE